VAKGRRPERDDRRETPRVREPHVADDVSVNELDKGVLNELRTLPEGLALIVGRHLAAADRALVDGDVPLAREHIAAAKRRAGRVAAVREAAGITAYLAGDFAEAAAELRTVRRMTGSSAYVPMIADCERGLGRPQRALEIIRETDSRRMETDTRIELTLVAAGARSDLGQLDAALVLLQIPELTSLPRGDSRARLQYAYADLLEKVGRPGDALEWMHRAADSDINGVTDAGERVDEEGGLTFIEEIDDSEE
jgi:tetratricopeptide (TPR) repeat protein